jgi:hypothetical protein
MTTWSWVATDRVDADMTARARVRKPRMLEVLCRKRFAHRHVDTGAAMV